MYDLIYSLIIFFATFLGAFVGLGGGVIIKPLLDLIGHDSMQQFNFIIAFVFQYEHKLYNLSIYKAKTKLDFKFYITFYLSVCSSELEVPVFFDYNAHKFLITRLNEFRGIILGISYYLSNYINLKKRKSFHVKSDSLIVRPVPLDLPLLF